MGGPDDYPFSEKLETGDVVPNDRTVTIRVHYARKRVCGKLLNQCPRCGSYFPEGSAQEHARYCRPKPVAKRKWTKRALKRALREADKAGKLAQFIDQNL